MDRNLNRTKTLFIDKGNTNKWLTERLGKDSTSASNWCANICQLFIEIIITISKLLKVDLNYLVRVK